MISYKLYITKCMGKITVSPTLVPSVCSRDGHHMILGRCAEGSSLNHMKLSKLYTAKLMKGQVCQYSTCHFMIHIYSYMPNHMHSYHLLLMLTLHMASIAISRCYYET